MTSRFSREPWPGVRSRGEMGVDMLIRQGVDFSAVDILACRCIDVDFEQDLKQTLNMFAG